MPRRAFPLLLSLLLLAGCATPAEAPDDEEAPATTTAGVPTPETPGDGEASTDAGSGASDDPAQWYTFAFDREVQPKSGSSGKIQSFSYTSANTDDGEETVIDVVVTMAGVSTETIRTTKTDVASGTFEQSTVSTPVEVTKLRHELTVVKDDSGERAAGDTSVVTVYVPTGDAAESATILWHFAKMEWTGADGEAGSWEYYVTPEMQEAQSAGDAVYVPFQEGDADSWWGFELMTSTYGFSAWFGPYMEDGLEEGSYSYGGFTHDARRETFTVGGYAFDGWTVEMRNDSGDSSSGWLMKASPDLPVPIAFRFASNEGSDSSSVASFELTDLKLG